MISNLNGSGSPKKSGFYRFAVQVRPPGEKAASFRYSYLGVNLGEFLLVIPILCI